MLFGKRVTTVRACVRACACVRVCVRMRARGLPQARAPGTPLSPQDLMGLRPVLSMALVMRREVVLRGALAPGHYHHSLHLPAQS